MPLNKVTLTWDLTDLISSGIPATISLIPTELLTDTTNHVVISEVARSQIFTGGTGSLGGIIACDNPTIQPSGWEYTVTITMANGVVIYGPYSYPINYAGGATQDLSQLTPVPGSIPLVITSLDGGSAVTGGQPVASFDGGNA
jgi:hypothetical protein